jgi:hypothetical protein
LSLKIRTLGDGFFITYAALFLTLYESPLYYFLDRDKGLVEAQAILGPVLFQHGVVITLKRILLLNLAREMLPAFGL